MEKKNYYFTQAHQDAIILYNNTEDFVEKDRIYTDLIHSAFVKLVECITNTFKVAYLEADYKTLQSECLTHIVKNMHHYKEESGKAFGYFSIIARNFIINISIDNKKRFDRYVSHDVLNDNGIQLPNKEKPTTDRIDELVNHWEKNLDIIFKKEIHKITARFILKALKEIELMPSYNRNKLIPYFRESLKEYKVTKAQYHTTIKKLKKHMLIRVIA